MKKILIFILLLALLLPACSSVNTGNEQNSNKQTDEQSGIEAWRKFPLIEDQREYQKWIRQSNQLPDHFVVWKDISYLGEWFCFHPPYYSSDKIDTTKLYTYDATVISGTDRIGIALVVNHAPDPEFKPFPSIGARSELTPVTILPEMENMCTVPLVGSEYGYIIVRDGLEYWYAKAGFLSSIRWYNNGIEYKLEGNALNADNYEAVASTFIGKLLSVNDTTFNAAFVKFKRSLT